MRNEATMNEEMTEMEMTQVCGGYQFPWRAEASVDFMEEFRVQPEASALRSGATGRTDFWVN